MSAVSGKDLVASVEGELDPVPSGTFVLVHFKQRRDSQVTTRTVGLLSKVYSVVYRQSMLELFPGCTDRAYEITSSS